MLNCIGKRGSKGIGNQRRLTRARNTCDYCQCAQLDSGGNVLKVVSTSSRNLDFSATGLTTSLWQPNLLLSREIRTCDGIRVFNNLFWSASSNNVTTKLTGAGAHVNNVVSCANGIFIVLDNKYGISAVPKLLERLNEAIIISLMQTNGRLVQNVENAHKTSANLSCQANTLGLSTRKRCCCTRKREIVQANVYQELQPCHNLFDNRTCNNLLTISNSQLLEELERLFTGKFTDLPDVFLANRNRENFWL